MKLYIDIDPFSFKEKLITQIKSKHNYLRRMIYNVTEEEFMHSIHSSIPDNDIISIKFKYYDRNERGKYQSLNEIIYDGGFSLRHLIIELDLKPGLLIEESEIQKPTVLNLLPVSYVDFSESIRYKHKKMKTKESYKIHLNHPFIPKSLFEDIFNEIALNCNSNQSLLSPVEHGVWIWWQQFICQVCGKRYFCECFRSAIEKFTAKAIEQKNNYSEGAWPYKFLNVYYEKKSTVDIQGVVKHSYSAWLKKPKGWLRCCWDSVFLEIY